MAEDTAKAAQTEAHADETDWKPMYEAAQRESRKWESRSKANADKTKAYDALAEGDATQEERIAALSSKIESLEGTEARRKLIAKVAETTGISASIVATLNGADEDTPTAQAKAVSEVMSHGAPTAPEEGQFPAGGAAKTNAQQFAVILGKLLGQ